MKESLNSQFEDSKNRLGEKMAFIRGLDGRIIFVESQHKTLNYLLQTAEGITCKAAAVWLKKELIKRKIQFYFSIHYHDELGVVCKEQDAELVAELAERAFEEAPKLFGITCMGGASKIGKNYAEVH